MGRLLRRWADPIVRRQLVRALEARDVARRDLLIERRANATLRRLTDTWQDVARSAHEELAELRQQQGEAK